MSNLINITNQEGQLLVSSREVSCTLDYLDLYELASKESYNVTKHGLDLLLELADLARVMTPEDKKIPFLDNAIRELIFRNFMSSIPKEIDIQEVAKRNISKVIEGCQIFNRINNHKHQPDLWVTVYGEEIPVEIKVSNFNYKALEQLKRYMKFYNCEKGVAIGEKLTTKLPKNIMFISIKELGD